MALPADSYLTLKKHLSAGGGHDWRVLIGGCEAAGGPVPAVSACPGPGFRPFRAGRDAPGQSVRPGQAAVGCGRATGGWVAAGQTPNWSRSPPGGFGGGQLGDLDRVVGEDTPSAPHLDAALPRPCTCWPWVDDPAYRRAVGVRLNAGEGRHSLARKTFFGHKGEVRQRYLEGQEDQLSALGLVVNMVTLCYTRYIDTALRQLRAVGHPVRDEDVARLSPLGYEHVNFHGHYSFTPPPAKLRPLRDPKAADRGLLGSGAKTATNASANEY